MDSCGEYFFFYGLTDFMLYLVLAWRYGFHLSNILSVFPRWCRRSFQDILSLQLRIRKSWFWCFTWSLALDPFTATSVQKLIFLFPTSADGRSSHFRLLVIVNHLAFFFLSLVTKCKHLLASTLTHIFYFLRQAMRNWPILLFCLNGHSFGWPANSNTEG